MGVGDVNQIAQGQSKARYLHSGGENSSPRVVSQAEVFPLETTSWLQHDLLKAAELCPGLDDVPTSDCAHFDGGVEYNSSPLPELPRRGCCGAGDDVAFCQYH